MRLNETEMQTINFFKMVRILSGFILVFIIGNLFAQQESGQVKELLHLVNYNSNRNVQRAIGEAESALKLAQNIKDREGIALSYYYLGKIYGSKMSKFDKGIFFHEKSVVVARELQDSKLVAYNCFNSGLFYYHIGLYGKALDRLLFCKNIFKNSQDVLGASFAQVNIAAIYAESGTESYAKAVTGFKDVINVSQEMKNDSLFIAAATYYTTALIAHKQFAEAEKYLNKALLLSKADNKYAEFTEMLYLNLGDIFFYGGMLKAAINQYEVAVTICMKNRIEHGLAWSSFKLGKAYFELGEIDLAKKHYTEAVQDFKRLGMRIKLAQVYDALSLLEYREDNFKDAFEFKSLELTINDSLFVNQNDLLFEVQSQEATKKINIQQKAEQINWLSLNLIFLVVLVGLFLGLVYLNHQRLRGAKRHTMLVNENLVLEKELQNKRFHEEKLMQQLEFNAKTLTTNTLNMIQKNEILLQIKEKAEILKTSFPEEFLPIKVKDLIHLVNFGLNIDKDWDNFKMHFEQVHTDFFDQLKAKYPHLNSGDLKLCALLKLNLDTKEIAAIMNISPQSVKVARSRLRKKLELDLTSNLSSFITQIQ